MRPVPITREPGCPLHEQTTADVLSDGRIAFLDKCIGNLARIPKRVTSLKSYDFAKGTTSRLRPYFLRLNLGAIAFSPTDSSRGLYAESDGLSGRLTWLGARRLLPIRLPVFNVGSPSWSPDGKWIAIDGVPLSAGPDSPLRRDTPWVLYRLRRDGKGVRRLVSDLISNAPSAWSADGRWLAFKGMRKDSTTGVWLLDMQRLSRPPQLLAEGEAFGPPAWLPDGRLIVPVGGPADIALGYRGPVGLYIVRLPKSAD